MYKKLNTATFIKMIREKNPVYRFFSFLYQ